MIVVVAKLLLRRMAKTCGAMTDLTLGRLRSTPTMVVYLRLVSFPNAHCAAIILTYPPMFAMPKITTWLRNLVSGHGHNDPKTLVFGSELPVGLPVLPSKRQQILTPTASQTDLVSDAKSKGSFFERLPREIRDQVYVLAFSDRTVHIDLRYQYPVSPDATRALTHAQVSTDPQWNIQARPQWTWWSSVCHRHPMGEPWADQCRTGSSRKMCDAFYSGEWPGKCFLGALGWMLSCKQA